MVGGSWCVEVWEDLAWHKVLFAVMVLHWFILECMSGFECALQGSASPPSSAAADCDLVHTLFWLIFCSRAFPEKKVLHLGLLGERRVDDVLVYGDTQPQHEDRLLKVLRRLEQPAVSLKGENEKDHGKNKLLFLKLLSVDHEFDQAPPPSRLKRKEKPNPAAPSCVSLKSDWSMSRPINFNDRPPADDLRVKFFSSESSCRSMKSEPSLNKPMEFKERKR
ncbi:hypothetical protein DNTS_027849 [Danionella cerebrum]|uniref:Uncharacterized protein n=1 Tax=Danionella cerebrum TaxID=2873325 RepID=A0A553QHN5_9TELE|nr:hypothetical protein DNTS_027849 [Danionella translucida]